MVDTADPTVIGGFTNGGGGVGVDPPLLKTIFPLLLVFTNVKLPVPLVFESVIGIQINIKFNNPLLIYKLHVMFVYQLTVILHYIL
jgi:hypothetical protein